MTTPLILALAALMAGWIFFTIDDLPALMDRSLWAALLGVVQILIAIIIMLACVLALLAGY